jgi:hypothetical protein
LTYQALDNGFASCADPERLQSILMLTKAPNKPWMSPSSQRLLQQKRAWMQMFGKKLLIDTDEPDSAPRLETSDPRIGR